jgi:hypothetical protein
VNRERLGTNIYGKRLFHALGGYNTLFFTGILAAAGPHLKTALSKYIHIQ